MEGLAVRQTDSPTQEFCAGKPWDENEGRPGDDSCVADLEDKTKGSSKDSFKNKSISDRTLDMFPCGKMNWEAVGWYRTASHS